MEIAKILLAMLAERERLGLPTRTGKCTCGRSALGLRCNINCNSVRSLWLKKPSGERRQQEKRS